MANEVFQRFEKKYMLDEWTMGQMLKGMKDIVPDKHCINGSYSICSLYYDTPDNYLIRTSLEKPAYREKLRLRSYGTPGRDAPVYIEIKKKVCGLGNKRRSAMRLGEAYRFLETGKLADVKPYMNTQVLGEVQFMLQSHNLAPAMYICYTRRAYTSVSRPDLRITFDSNVMTRRSSLRLEAGEYGEQLLPEGRWLMEIKVADSMPVWLVRLLSGLEVYPTSFSKYGNEYKRYMGGKQPDIPGIMLGGERPARLAAAY